MAVGHSRFAGWISERFCLSSSAEIPWGVVFHKSKAGLGVWTWLFHWDWSNARLTTTSTSKVPLALFRGRDAAKGQFSGRQ